jgi:hypothetical protein
MNNINNVTCDIPVKVWPYLESATIVAGIKNGTGFSIQVDTEGRLIVNITYKFIQRQVVFQPLEIQGFDTSIMSVKLSIDEVDILPNKLADGKSQSIKVSAYTPRRISIPDLTAVQARNESEQFFLRTVDDLIKRYDSKDSYETLKIAGLLRLLLLDNPCLIDIINKEYRLKLEYKARDVRVKFKKYSKDAPSVAASVSLYAGEGNQSEAPSKVRNAFLKLPFGAVDGQWSTVEDVILYCANKAGGVHYDQSLPTKPGQQKVLEIDKIISTQSKSPTYHNLLHQITFITLDAIKPLVDAVVSSASKEANNEPLS